MTVDVALVTWPNHIQRWRYFQITALSLFAGLTGCKIRYRCSAESRRDPKHQWYGEELSAFCQQHDIQLQWHGKPSLGGNMNSALRMCENDTILLVQDDCMLAYPLDLSGDAGLLQADRSVDMIRYQWPPKHSVNRCRLLPRKDERRQFELTGRFYSDRPHLRRRDYMQKHGWYTTQGYHGKSEVDMADTLRANNAMILAAQQQYFVHFGHVSSVVNDGRSRAFSR